ncbi:Uncharacterised protein [uncultured archaeon]|nr:Uncharacterised protein [uncultured archaeon]
MELERLDDLKAAVSGDNPDWEFVDSAIPQISKDAGYFTWAFNRGIRDPDENVRDLAVSIIEKSEIPEDVFAKIRFALNAIMTDKDAGEFVRIRAAFALANHGPGIYKNDVKEKLDEVRTNRKYMETEPDLVRSANAYCQTLSPKRVTAR